jgi:hypothetical protein
MPYFGRWPEWFSIFLETCRWNASIDWLFFTDCGIPAEPPRNVRFVQMSLREMESLAASKLRRPVELKTAYKVCDLRLAYGAIFEEFLNGYDFWGFGDVDVVYGDLRDALHDKALEHDIISFHRNHISGHLAFFKNNEGARTIYQRIESFNVALTADEFIGCDELLFPGRLGWGKQIPIDAVSARSLSIHAFEAFSTPFSLTKPWTDGTFRFPAEWIWREGRLRNDKDAGRYFSYLHFTHWNSGRGTIPAHGGRHWRELKKVVYVDPAEAQNGFRINSYGFHRLGSNVSRPDFTDTKWNMFRRRTANMVRFHLREPKWMFMPRVLAD